MNLSAVNSLSFADPSGVNGGFSLTTSGGGAFETVLRAQDNAMKTAETAENGSSETGALKQAKDAANQLVATAFLQPLLAQLRQDPFRTPLFHGGQGEDAFGAQLDTRVADALAKRLNLPLADKIVKQIVRHQQAGHAKDADTAGQKVNLHG